MVSALLVYLVIASNIGSGKSSLTVSRTSVVLIGERVELKCSVNGGYSPSWRYTSWNSSTKTSIYLGRDIITLMRSRYKIDKRINGQHNLIIDSVDLAHAGRYQCIGVLQPLINDIQLIVLGSHPVCVASISVAQNTVTEYPHLSIWCIISYTGNGFPAFSWTKINADKNIAVNTTTSDTSQVPFTSTSFITQQLQANDSGITFYCRITFQTPNTSQENPVDAYEYMRNFTLPNGPRNLAIVEYKDRLECSADGNPTPTYRWTGLDTKSSIEGPVFVLGVKDQTVQCTATNVFGSERKNYTTTKVLTDKKSCWDMHTIGLIITVATLFVFGVVLVIVGLKLRQLIITIDKDKASAKTAFFPPQQSSKRPNSPPPADEYAEVERADVSNNYCALADQPTAAHKTQIYCELRPIDQRNSKQSAKQRVESRDR